MGVRRVCVCGGGGGMVIYLVGEVGVRYTEPRGRNKNSSYLLTHKMSLLSASAKCRAEPFNKVYINPAISSTDTIVQHVIMQPR